MLEAARRFKQDNCNTFRRSIYSPFVLKLNQPECRTCKIFCALPETAASVAVAATIVGAAATLLKKRSEASERTEVSMTTNNSPYGNPRRQFCS